MDDCWAARFFFFFVPYMPCYKCVPLLLDLHGTSGALLHILGPHGVVSLYIDAKGCVALFDNWAIL